MPHGVPRKLIFPFQWHEGAHRYEPLAGLRAFLSATPHCVAAVLAYNGTEMIKLGERQWAVPLGLFLS